DEFHELAHRADTAGAKFGIRRLPRRFALLWGATPLVLLQNIGNQPGHKRKHLVAGKFDKQFVKASLRRGLLEYVASLHECARLGQMGAQPRDIPRVLSLGQQPSSERFERKLSLVEVSKGAS